MSSSKAAAARDKKESDPHALLIVGTYHGVMAGLTYKQQKFFMKFSVKRHVGSINGLGITDRYVSSCGVDERVFLFTNKADTHQRGGSSNVRLADLGSVAPPAEVVCLRFAGHKAAQESKKGSAPSTYLLCGCSDGQLLVYRTRDWSVQTTLTVHERAVAGMAVHPGSQGLLAVTVGLDRSVAVLDLAKGKLLTKWKYNSRRALAGGDAAAKEDEKEEKEQEGTEGEEEEDGRQVKKVKVDPVTRSLFTKEEPVGVLFSPAGTRLAVYSHISCIVYDATTMEAVDGFVMERPQPSQEIVCALFTAEDRLLFGNEAGEISTFVVRPKGTLTAAGGAAVQLPTTLPVSYPEEIKEKAQQLLATRLDVALETRQKNPLRHTSRIKALCLHTDPSAAVATIFSMDANGVVLALHFDPKHSERLQYVASGNCRGRVTCMNILSL